MTKPLINRRQFVQLIAMSASMASGRTWAMSANKQQTDTDIAEQKTLGIEAELVYKDLADPWLSLAEVQEHLFPAEHSADSSSPGARDICALRFLRNMLEAPDTDTEEKEFIIKGVSWLNDLSVKNHQRVFVKLNSDEKEKVLRRIETSRAGSRWLSLMMSYLIEALLSDPVYGGNKDRQGWQWLEHIAGFPTPTTDQVYYKLGQQTDGISRRRTKA